MKTLSISCTPPQAEFHALPHKYTAFVGGMGCVRDSTPIATSTGYVEIADLCAGDDVLSWNEIDQQFQFAPTSGAFPKGKSSLYRVVTTQGEFVANRHHQVRAPNGTYRPLASLKVGSWLSAGSKDLDLLQSGVEISRIWSHEGDLNYWERLANSLGDYEELGHESDREFHQAIHNAVAFGQRFGGARSLGVLPVGLLMPKVVTPIQVTRIERLKTKEWYWDMHVAGNNNYLTQDGVIHHNSGKTETMCNQAIIDAFHSPDALISLYAPTYDLVSLITAPRLLEKLDKYEIGYRYNKTKNYIETTHKQTGNFILRTLDKPSRIVGYQAYRSHIDEIDTLGMNQAQEAWQKIIARTRQVPERGSNPHFNRVSVYTTPEGFKFTYDRWVKRKSPAYGMVQASSRTNPYLPSDYVESLLESYPPELRSAYIDGMFVNLTSGTVYKSYNRAAHNTNERIKPHEVLYIGCDFNVTKQAATIYVRRDGGRTWHAVAELVNMYDTPEMIQIIKERYPTNRIIMYPDASGQARKTVNAHSSDIVLLKQANFEVRVRPTNPSVRDRINAMNTALSSGMVFINVNACPNVAQALEQQAYNANGEPDKQSGKDHQNDATTYPIAYEIPIRKTMPTLNVSF